MKLAKWASAAIAGAMMMVAPSAGAKIYHITYSGQVSKGYDYIGAFGAPTNSLTGNFTAIFRLDTATPGVQTGQTINQSYIQGFGASSPVPGTLNINNNIYNFGSYVSYVQVTNDYPVYPNSLNDSFQVGAVNNNFRETILMDVYTSTGNYLKNKYVQAFDYIPQPGDFQNSFFAINDLNSTALAGGALYVNHVFVIEKGGVPEPATWSFLILGFGGIGATMRRRGKRALALAAA